MGFRDQTEKGAVTIEAPRAALFNNFNARLVVAVHLFDGNEQGAVRLAAAHLPFPAVCLQQALAAKYMLRRRRITGALHLGVATHRGSRGAIRAHAWLDAAGVNVTGGPVPREFTEVACFV